MVKKRVLTERLGITVSPELKDKLDRIRQRKMLLWSELIREAIGNYLKKGGGEIMKKVALILAILMLFNGIAQAGDLMFTDPLKEQPIMIVQSENEKLEMSLNDCIDKCFEDRGERIPKELPFIYIGFFTVMIGLFAYTNMD